MELIWIMIAFFAGAVVGLLVGSRSPKTTQDLAHKAADKIGEAKDAVVAKVEDITKKD